MGCDELVYDLRGQVNPNVEDPVFIRVLLKRLLQVRLNPLDHLFCALEIVDVPLVVCLIAGLFTK